MCSVAMLSYEDVRNQSGCQYWVVRLTFCGCGNGLGVGHGERDGSYSAVMWRGSQDRGEVARDLSHHLTTAVRLHVGHRQRGNTIQHKHFISSITYFGI